MINIIFFSFDYMPFMIISNINDLSIIAFYLYFSNLSFF